MSDVDDRLERELRELRVAWPETPDLTARVAARLAAAPPPRRRGWRPSWITTTAVPPWRARLVSAPTWQIAAVIAAVAIAAVMAVPPARSAVLEWLGFSSVRVERGEPRPSRFGAALELGEPVTLEQARRRADFRVVVPSVLGPPDAVYFTSNPARVDFVYRPRPGLPRSATTGVGLLVTQFRARATPLIEKTAGRDSTVEQLDVAGDPALFISGADHGFAYMTDDSQFGGFEEQRLAGDTLVVDRRDGILLRVEGDVSREEAVRIAASAR
jgi:hypothetical protein